MDSCCGATKSWEYLQFEGFLMTEHSLPQFAVHNHHSAAEDLHMLWQQIRHSKEQQTFSASSNRAALSAPTPAVWRYCSQVLKLLRGSALDILYAHTLTHTCSHTLTHTQIQTLTQTHWHTHKNTNTHTHLHTHSHKHTHWRTHTQIQTLKHTHWSPTVVRVYQHFVTSGRDAALWSFLYSLCVCLCVCRCVSGRVCTGLCSSNIWSLDWMTLS